jgi:hypothetical protein
MRIILILSNSQPPQYGYRQLHFSGIGEFELSEIPTFSDLASNVLIEPCHEAVQDLRTSFYACDSHPKMLYSVAAICRSVTEAGVFPFLTVAIKKLEDPNPC